MATVLRSSKNGIAYTGLLYANGSVKVLRIGEQTCRNGTDLGGFATEQEWWNWIHNQKKESFILEDDEVSRSFLAEHKFLQVILPPGNYFLGDIMSSLCIDDYNNLPVNDQDTYTFIYTQNRVAPYHLIHLQTQEANGLKTCVGYGLCQEMPSLGIVSVPVLRATTEGHRKRVLEHGTIMSSATPLHVKLEKNESGMIVRAWNYGNDGRILDTFSVMTVGFTDYAFA